MRDTRTWYWDGRNVWVTARFVAEEAGISKGGATVVMQRMPSVRRVQELNSLYGYKYIVTLDDVADYMIHELRDYEVPDGPCGINEHVDYSRVPPPPPAA